MRLEERVCYADFQLYLAHVNSAERGQEVRFTSKTRDEPAVCYRLQEPTRLTGRQVLQPYYLRTICLVLYLGGELSAE